MTLAVQVSYKKSDGTIYVIGGDDVDQFTANLFAVVGGDQEMVDAIFADMISCLTPMSAPAATAGFYTPQAAPGPQGPSQPLAGGAPRTSPMAVAVKIPWAQKAEADPYLAPLKASRQAQWDAANKQWVLMPGVDLTPFARWLPPGVA